MSAHQKAKTSKTERQISRPLVMSKTRCETPGSKPFFRGRVWRRLHRPGQPTFGDEIGYRDSLHDLMRFWQRIASKTGVLPGSVLISGSRGPLNSSRHFAIATLCTFASMRLAVPWFVAHLGPLNKLS